MAEKVIGIIGGMGPEAAARLFLCITRLTPVNRDQDHYRVVMDSNPKIPDRTAAIKGEGPSPVNAIVQAGKNLELLGATVGGMPCITAHYYFSEIQNNLSYPLINALEALKEIILHNHAEIERIGILATTGTVQSRLFEQYLPHRLIYPAPETQENLVMEAIYGQDGIKKGETGERPGRLLKLAGEELINKGAQLLVAGCTEIPLALDANQVSVPLLDILEILARSLVEYPE